MTERDAIRKLAELLELAGRGHPFGPDICKGALAIAEAMAKDSCQRCAVLYHTCNLAQPESGAECVTCEVCGGSGKYYDAVGVQYICICFGTGKASAGEK